MARRTTSSGESIAELKAQIRLLEAENKLLRAEKQHLLREMFRSKTEVLHPGQLQLLMSTAEVAAVEVELKEKVSSGSTLPRKKRRKRKLRLPEDLPTEDIVLDPEEVTDAPHNFRRIGEEITSEIDVIPPKYFCRRFIRGKYVRLDDRDAAPVIAPLPARLIEGSYASAGIITDIAVKKFQDHLPLYRQEQILKDRYGIEISRQTMAEWIRAAADWLSPIYRLIRKGLQERKYLQVDETPVKYCNKDGPPGSSQGYFWVYNDPWEKDVLYEWHQGRAASCLADTLKDFRGTVQCDGYGAYTSYAKDKSDIEIACCWAHARRKFHEAIDEAPAVAGWFLKQIQALYAIETSLRVAKAAPEVRLAARKRGSLWRVKLIKKGLKLQLPRHLPRSRMGKAVSYALSRFAQLEKFCHNGLIMIDNNGVENAIRPTAVGKKNWLFVGHPEAGDRSAILYTIIENCKRRGISPQEYLKDVLTRLPSMKMSEVETLLPANWLEARKGKAA